MRNFREYDIWKDSMELVNQVYDIVQQFPKDEKFNLVSQIVRSAISIPSNIAEGSSRTSEKDFARFLGISLGSAFELETQIRIAEKRELISSKVLNDLLLELISLQKRMSALRKKIT